MEIAVLALGCFWGPEIKFSKIDGIIKTEVGYCGGNSPVTTYKEVCTGTTNHAEVVKLDFDEKIISYEKILNFFFEGEGDDDDVAMRRPDTSEITWPLPHRTQGPNTSYGHTPSLIF